MTEEPLHGGLMNGGVVRVGDTVRRAAHPQTPTIHRLLDHVRAQGVAWVPRVHGYDDAGREILDFIPGEVGHGEPPYLRDPRVLADVARAARQWHDATETFDRRPEDVWFWQQGKVPAEVICHNDFAPYNHVFRDGTWAGAIDYDLCYPGPRLWDLAWTAYRYCPLTPPPGADVADDAGLPGLTPDRSMFTIEQMEARATAFLEAYGPVERLEAGEPARPYSFGELLAWVPPRLHAIADWAASQDSPKHRYWAAMYRAHAEWISEGGFAR